MTRTAAPPGGGMSVTPPAMHPGQLEVLHDPARFKLLRAGRRWRKTGLGIVQALTGYEDGQGGWRPGALGGGRIGWWVPSMTARYVVSDWEPLASLANQIPGTRVEIANRRVILPSGGSVLMLTGDNVDSGRGLGLDGAIVDEAQLHLPNLWTDTIRPTLMDRRGWAMFLFTPPRQGQSWVADLCADMAGKPGWKEFHYSTRDNPEIDPAEIDDLVSSEEMSSLVRLVEIEAEWPSAGAGMFNPDWIQRWRATGDGTGYILGETVVKAADCKRFSTVDIAWSLDERADWTVISTWALTPYRHLVLLSVVRAHVTGDQFVPELRKVYEGWDPAYFVLERDGAQLDIVKTAQRSGLPIREVRAGGRGKKEVRAWPAVARMESKQVWFPTKADVPGIQVCEEELVGFPAAAHDDFVDTFVYAVLHTAKPGRAVGF